VKNVLLKLFKRRNFSLCSVALLGLIHYY